MNDLISNNVPETEGTANGPALTGGKVPYNEQLGSLNGMVGTLSSAPGIPMNPRPVEDRDEEPRLIEDRDEEPRLIEVDEECGDDCCCEGEVDCCEEEPLAHRNICIKSGYQFRDFSIKHLNAGYIVTIGCHKIAIETKEKLAKIVSNYILDPNKIESAFHVEKTVDSML